MTDARPAPVFEAPWHAQVFALTVHLNAAGHFGWPEWVARFGATLQRHGIGRDLNGGEDYFMAWITALEELVQELGLTEAADLAELRRAWERAYLSTPHGAPVTLDDAVDP